MESELAGGRRARGGLPGRFGGLLPGRWPGDSAESPIRLAQGRFAGLGDAHDRRTYLR